MVNNVVIGDLSLYDGDGTLRVGISNSSSLDVGDNPILDSNTIFKGVFKNIGADDSSLAYVFDMSPPSDNGCLFRFQGDGSKTLWFVVWTTGGIVFANNSVVVDVGDVCEYEITLSGGFVNIRINGVDELTPYTGTLIQPTTGTMHYAANIEDGGDPFAMELYSCSATGSHDYDMTNQYGNTSVIDSSGEGNDGELNNAEWWKKDVDQNFLTQDAYVSQWVIPMEESQNVVGTDVILPVASDPSWVPYNDDPVFDFTVDTQITNTVVIGDISKYDGVDCQKFNEVDTHNTFPNLGIGTDFTFACDFITYSTTGRRVVFHPRAERDYTLRIDGTNLLLASYDGTGNTVILESDIVIGKHYSVSFTVAGTALSWVVSGVSGSGTIPVPNDTSETNYIGVADPTANNTFNGIIRNVVITTASTTAEYINDGEFGNSVLVDASGNGNDGAVVNGIWWKMFDADSAIDENFSSQQEYIDSWVIPMEQSQYVIGTTVVLPPASDSSWIPYNSDPVFDFTVTQQSSGGIGGGSFTFGKLDYSLGLSF